LPRRFVAGALLYCRPRQQLVSTASTPPATPGTGSTSPADVSGAWAIHETIDNSACNGTGATDDYSINVTQQGGQITVVAGANTFHGTVDGNTIAWTGQYSMAALGGM